MKINMTKLYSLLSEPFIINDSVIRGLLSISGNIEKNWIQFSFTYEDETKIAPVLIRIFDGSSYYEYLCSPDDEKNTVSSSTFEPEFLISQGFSVEAVLPLISRGNV